MAPSTPFRLANTLPELEAFAWLCGREHPQALEEKLGFIFLLILWLGEGERKKKRREEKGTEVG